MHTIISRVDTFPALIAALPTMHLRTYSRNPAYQVSVAYLPLDYHSFLLPAPHGLPPPLNIRRPILSHQCYRHLPGSLGYCRPVFFTPACQRDEWLGRLMTDKEKPSLLSFSRLCTSPCFYCRSLTNYSGVDFSGAQVQMLCGSINGA